MNPITYSLERMIEFDIPKPILNMAFISRLMVERYTLDTLESRIREKVIEKRVLVDCNLQHGTLMNIPLAQCEKIEGDFYQAVYRIPKSLTQGKRITTCLHLTQATGLITANSANGMSNSTGLFAAAYINNNRTGGIFSANMQGAASVAPVEVVSNALTYLIGENTILVKDTYIVPSTQQFRVMVENDENFNHIQPQWYTTFHELCLEAVKVYIFNNLVLEQDNVFINSGGELARFKDIVDSYEDSREMYKELLEAWVKAAYLNDNIASTRHYQLSVGGSW